MGNQGVRQNLCVAAARGGHLAVLEVLAESGRLFSGSGRLACAAAAIGGHLRTLQFLVSSGAKMDPLTTTAACASRFGMGVLAWACDNGCKLRHSAAEAAARRGDVDCLRWLRARGAPCRQDVALCAAAFGHVLVIKYLMEETPCLARSTRGFWAAVARLAADRHHSALHGWLIAAKKLTPNELVRANSASALELQAGVEDGEHGEGLGLWAPEYALHFARLRARECMR